MIGITSFIIKNTFIKYIFRQYKITAYYIYIYIITTRFIMTNTFIEYI